MAPIVIGGAHFTVRVHLYKEYFIKALSPCTAGDQKPLETVQRRSIKAVTNLKGGPYKARLLELQMGPMKRRDYFWNIGSLHLSFNTVGFDKK